MPHFNRREQPAGRRAKRIRAVAVTFAVVAALTACTGQGSAANNSGEPTGKLTYWYAPNTPDAKGVADFTKFNVTPFQKQYSKVDLQAVQKNVNTLNQNIQIALAAGKGPDIVTGSGIASVFPYAQAGYLKDLTSTAKQNNWANKLLPWALESAKVDGKVVALPQGYETLSLFYNKTLFKKNGWTPPKNRQELADLAAKMLDKGITPFAAGNSDYPPATQWLVSAFMNEVAGPQKIHDALTGKITWTAPEFVKTMDLLKEYFDKGWFGGGVKKYFSTTDPQKYTQLASGEAGMYISGTWEFVTLPEYFGKGNKNEFDWAPLPSLADGVPITYPLSIGNTLSINEKTQNSNAAEAYLNWQLNDTKTMWAAVAATGVDPLPVNINKSDIPSNVDPRYARVYTSLQAASESGNVGYTTWTSWGGKATQFISDNADKVLNGSESVGDFLKGMDAAFQSDKARNLIPTPYTTGEATK
ncbi:extracellular solute-binding protein [Diaminobutyricibacter tongyongensis]|uniref:Extracellular solute-binding protein n=1 Tax=Leifsonia tongyongensis TaxID=1268043 RepID=A0A6L9Y1U5_9MICO|nr:extracellular solute-binding protein [Diaminobutyricibacter tongyongensis]NEN07662.1 extracellular solute-binding protein [Diaminobutyricibacter tongyongensis]